MRQPFFYGKGENMLPPEFLSRMESLLGEEYGEFMAAYDRPLQKGLRLSRRKRLQKPLPFHSVGAKWLCL